jgi:predicted dehydrogenase
MDIKIGIIGCGYWGPNLIRNFYKIKECKVIYACDLSRERLSKIKEMYPQIKITQNYLDMLEVEEIDAVVVATPPITHYKIAKDALLYGKHLLVEKPFVTSLEKAEELINLAEKLNKKIMVGYTFLYHPCVKIIKEMVESGYLGKIYYIYSQRINLGLFQKDINVVWDLAPHDLSIIKYIFGELPFCVNAIGYSHIIDGIEDVAFLNLKNDFFTVNIHLSWLAPYKVRLFTIVGEDKMLVFDDVSDQKLVVHHKSVKKPAYFYSLDEFKFAYKYGKTEILNFSWIEPLFSQCKDFVDCILYDKEPLSSARNTIDILKLVLVANKSIKEEGKWKKVNDL